MAVIAGNLELAEMIQNYKPEDIGKCCHPDFSTSILLKLIITNAFWICTLDMMIFMLHTQFQFHFHFHLFQTQLKFKKTKKNLSKKKQLFH